MKMLTPMISDNSLPWMNVKRTSSFAPSQPSLSLCRAVGTGGGWANFVDSCLIMFVHVQSCLLMLVHGCSCSFVIVHVCSSLFKPVHFVSCLVIFVDAWSFLHIFVHFCASLFILVLAINTTPLHCQTFLRPWVMASFRLVGRRSKTNLYNDVSLK